MTTTVRAVFDGQVFRPDGPVHSEPDARSVLPVQGGGHGGGGAAKAA